MVRKAFLTPPDIPEGLTCRTLKMPASKEWLGIFNSALLNTVQAWQWEQVNATDLTIEEAVAKCQEILGLFWAASECDVCLQPSGQPFFRVGEFGQLEQLGEGEWTTPYGDYELPPITPREGGSASDKRCLAAANAANVLRQLYEQVADSFAAGRTTAEAITDLLLLIAAIIAAPLSLIVAAILTIAEILFKVFYESVEFISADYWTEDFDALIQCALFECASVDGGGIVTFDYDCFTEKLANKSDVIANPYTVLLFGQIVYLLSWIGGDGLNLAGATTAITSAECECEWCRVYDFEIDEWGFEMDVEVGNNTASYSPGNGWVAESFNLPSPNNRGTYIRKLFGTTLNLTEVTMQYHAVLPVTSSVIALTNGSYGTLGVSVVGATTPEGINSTAWSGGVQGLRLQVGNVAGGTPAGGSTIYRLTLRGIGDPPEDGEMC